MLQLGQALRGGTIQAEEYNSLLDGLFPLLQAAAGGSDRFGGSVAKLTKAVKDGKVTSAEFFQAILNGSDILEQRAAKATLTTSAALTTLNNALTVYFGTADKANGMSAALATAIKLIADNLDTLIPALTVVVAALGVNYVRSALAARGATLTLATAMTALSNVAIAAVIGGLIYLATEASRAEQKLADLQSGVQDARDSLEAARARAQAAGVQVKDVGDKAGTATTPIFALAGAVKFLSDQYRELADSAKLAALAELAGKRGKAQTELDEIRATRASQRKVNSVTRYFAPIALANALTGDSRQARTERLDQQEAALAEQIRLFDEQKRILAQTPESAFAPPTPHATPTGETAAERRKRLAEEAKAAREAEASARDRAAAADDERRLAEENLQAQLAITDDLDERFRIQQEIRDAEIASRKQANQEAVRRGDLLPSEAARQAAALDELRGRQRTADLNEYADARDRQINEERRGQISALEGEANLARTREQRLEIERQILELREQEEEAALRTAYAEGRIKDYATARANLQREQAARREGVERDHASPLNTYIEDLRSGAKSVNDALEEAAVGGLRDLEDGFARAAKNALGLHGILGDIVGDLIRIAARQAILAAFDAGKGGKGGGFLASAGQALSSVFGGKRATGGPVSAGKAYLVGERGPEIVMMGANANVVPNHAIRQNAAVRGGQTIVQQSFTIDARYGITTPELLDHVNAVARRESVKAGAASFSASQQAMPGTLARYNLLEG